MSALQDAEPPAPKLSYRHIGTLEVQNSDKLRAKAEVVMVASVMHPYVAPVIAIKSASSGNGSASMALSKAKVAAMEADVNVAVPAEHLDDPMPMQLARLCKLLLSSVQD